MPPVRIQSVLTLVTAMLVSLAMDSNVPRTTLMNALMEHTTVMSMLSAWTRIGDSSANATRATRETASLVRSRTMETLLGRQIPVTVTHARPLPNVMVVVPTLGSLVLASLVTLVQDTEAWVVMMRTSASLVPTTVRLVRLA